MRTFLTAALFAIAAPAAFAPATLAQSIQPGIALPMADRTLQTDGGGSLTLRQAAKSGGTLVVFWANRCAWADRNAARLNELVTTYGDRFGVVLVSTTPLTAVPSPGLPVVLDGSGELIRAFGVQRAPQAFVFNAAGTLTYAGALDDSPADAGAARKRYAADALAATAAGQTPATTTSEAFGCIVRAGQ